MKKVQNERPPCLQNNRESWDSGGGGGEVGICHWHVQCVTSKTNHNSVSYSSTI